MFKSIIKFYSDINTLYSDFTRWQRIRVAIFMTIEKFTRFKKSY